MSISYYTHDVDSVIEGHVVTATATYDFAIQNFIPLMGRLDIQRDTLNSRFYSRLEGDIVRGCVMPPITIALVHSFARKRNLFDYIKSYINSNLDSAFILDGIQRLNTLQRASSRDGFNGNRFIHINFIITNSRDRLLYRMITLNNGQKPMSARHQIDVLANAFFDFDSVGLNLVAEKGRGRVRAPESFRKADFVKGYIAYLSGSVNIDNQKIIEDKMDELIASKIIESDISTGSVEFMDVVELVNRFSTSAWLRDWVRVQNNFIGFCVGSKKSVDELRGVSNEEMTLSLMGFEEAFKSINVSKVNIGKIRRELVSFFIENFDELKSFSEYELLDRISERI